MVTTLIAIRPVIAAELPASGRDAAAVANPVKENKVKQTETKQPKRFDIWDIAVDGNTLLETITVELALLPYLGPDKSYDDVNAARGNLEKQYKDKGYPAVIVNIPEQEIKNGVVRLKVIESRIDRLRIKGSRYFSLSRIRQQLTSLEEDNLLYLPAVQEQLAKFNNRSPDRSLNPILRPGRTPGTVEVELRVNDNFPVHGALELNNHNSQSTEEARASASISYDNLWQKEHSFSMQYQTAPANREQVKVFSATYLYKLEQSDNLLAFYGVRSRSNISTIGELTVIGDGDILGVRAIIPFEAQRNYYHNATFGIDYKNFKESLSFDNADSMDTPIDYFAFSAQYSGTLQNRYSSHQINAAFNFGIRGLDDDDVPCFELNNGDFIFENEFECKRFNAEPNYSYVRLGWTYSQDIKKGFSFHSRVNAQLTGSNLISNEQFSAGGAQSVRGYFESQLLGDRGVVGKVELRMPGLNQSNFKFLNEFYAHVFFDGAKLYTREALPSQDSSGILSSFGFGFRLRVWKQFSFEADLAQVNKPAGDLDKRDTRTHMRFEYRF